MFIDADVTIAIGPYVDSPDPNTVKDLTRKVSSNQSPRPSLGLRPDGS